MEQGTGTGANAPTPEAGWIAWLGETDDPALAMRAFCPHYFCFSYRQVVAFSGLFKQVDPLDRESLAMLADVLFEELGQGEVEQVHSLLFERFAASVGLAPDRLRLEDDRVLPGVLAYVEELERAFGAGSRAEALATYVFLETSAVDTYGPLVEVLSRRGFSESDLVFFARHAGVEPEHAEAAEAMLRRHGLGPAYPEVAAQTEKLGRLWRAFWIEIDEECRRAAGA